MGDHDQDSLYDLTINQMEAGQPDASNGNQVAVRFLEALGCGWLLVLIVEVTMNNEHCDSSGEVGLGFKFSDCLCVKPYLANLWGAFIEYQ